MASFVDPTTPNTFEREKTVGVWILWDFDPWLRRHKKGDLYETYHIMQYYAYIGTKK